MRSQLNALNLRLNELERPPGASTPDDAPRSQGSSSYGQHDRTALILRRAILAGGDLNAAVDHARGQAARHERYLHIWGIAEGLELKGVDKKTATGVAYKEITVTAGIAMDASGREVLLPTDARLPDEAFEQSNVWVGQPADGTAWYPAYVMGRDERASGTGANG